MSEDNKTGFEGLGDMIDDDGNFVTESDEDVETPPKDELRTMTTAELEEKYGPLADAAILNHPDLMDELS